MKSHKVFASVAALIVAISSGLVAGAPSAQAHDATSSRIKACTVGPGGQLVFAATHFVEPWTQANPVNVVLRNTSKASCTLHGFPTISILDSHGKAYPFTYSHRTISYGRQIAAPTFTVKPGGTAEFLTNNGPCNDGPTHDIAMASLRFTAPNGQTGQAIKTHRYTYCTQDRSASTISVSPYAPNYNWIEKNFLVR